MDQIAILLPVAFTLLSLLGGCKKENSAPAAASQPTAQTQLRIAAAADLQFALAELGKSFEADHPAIHLSITYGSSGNFFSQLSNNAPYDVFLSADASYPQKLVEQGQAGSDTTFHYAIGRIVVWTPKDSSIDITKFGLTALTDPAVRKIAIANPQHAPYGRAAVAAMRSAGVYERIRDRLVLGENIAQAAQFVSTGSADVGIIALSLALAPQMEDKGAFWEIPSDTYPPLDQAGVILNWATDPTAARAFRDFLMSDSARHTLSRFGFSSPAR
jgi:molybdate transport system substrate-binding protein